MGADRPKQYLPISGSTVLYRTLERLQKYTKNKGIMVGLATDDLHWPNYKNEIISLDKFKGSFTGGQTRAETVLNGCEALLQEVPETDWVLVHDAARPCVRVSDIEHLVEAVTQAGADGGLLALPMSDTVKKSDFRNFVSETIPRDGLWRAQTPQMFRLHDLKRSLQTALNLGMDVTDEAQAIEAGGMRPLLVPGHSDNIKITQKQDLILAELFLKQQALEEA